MKQNRRSGLIRRFLPYFKKYKWILVLDLICASLTTVCELVLPLIVRFITDRATSAPHTLTVRIILSVGMFYLILRVIDSLASYYMANMGHVMGVKIESDMRRDMFSHLANLSFSYYDEAKVGTIMSRITSDLFDVTEFAHHCPEEFFISFIKITVAFCILASVNIWLTLIIFSILPFLFVVAFVLNRKMRRNFKESRVQVGELNSQVEDSLLGIRVVKSFANEPIEVKKFEKGNTKFVNIKKKSYLYMGLFQSSTRSFDGIMYIAVVVSGSLFMLGGHITAPDLIAYLLYVTTLLTSIRRIVEFTEQFEKGMTGIERFAEILETPSEPGYGEGEKIEKIKGELEFNDVSFSYAKEKGDVLANISLKVNAGENIAVVGPSGSGKTTLCSLVSRFYEPQQGSILLDGKDIKDISLSALRDAVGVVQQDVYLFSGSVIENILYGKKNGTREEAVEAAKKAGAHEFISALPDGYDTYVGERGVMLSGGQKQRISIARVFVKNPPILILDEATSALDNESEQHIKKSLAELSKGRTTFTIAHRLTTVRNASRIIVLTEKGIEQQGTHEELVSCEGVYKRLYSNSIDET